MMEGRFPVRYCEYPTMPLALSVNFSTRRSRHPEYVNNVFASPSEIEIDPCNPVLRDYEGPSRGPTLDRRERSADA